MSHPVDIVKELFNDFQNQLVFTASSFTDNGDGTYTLFACETFHLQECFKLEINGVTYEILEVLNNESVKLKGSIMPPLEFPLNWVYFFAGSVRETDVEMHKTKKQVSERTPFVFMHDKLREKRYCRDNRVELEFTARLFFLTQNNFKGGWRQDDHREKAIKPMRNLIFGFVNYLKSREDLGNIDSYDVDDDRNFGMFQTKKGQENLYFSDFLSGTELIIKLPIRKNYKCKCK